MMIMSKKIISIHSNACHTKCEHANVCYFINGEHKKENMKYPISSVFKNITYDYDMHYSACNMEDFMLIIPHIIFNDNRFITVSHNLFKQLSTLEFETDKYEKLKSKCQITVYDLDTIKSKEYKDVQKMFLIKDDKTYETAINILKTYKVNGYSKIHFPIEQSWAANNKRNIISLVSYWNQSEDKSLSLDSCLENYILNNTCVYADDYIDLRYDGTVRRCPFTTDKKDIHDINIDNPNDMFDIPFEPMCIWKEMFKE